MVMNENKNADKGRHLNLHDWILTREIRQLDEAYDKQIYILSSRMLECYSISDSDERQEAYDDILEQRDRLRSIYIQRRNGLKGQFSGNMTTTKGRYPWGYKKMTIEETTEAFKDDPMVEACLDENNMSKKPETTFVLKDHPDLKGTPGITMSDLIDILSEQEEP